MPETWLRGTAVPAAVLTCAVCGGRETFLDRPAEHGRLQRTWTWTADGWTHVRCPTLAYRAVGPIYGSRVTYYDRLARGGLERERQQRDVHWWEYARERACDPGCQIGVDLDG